MLKERILFTDCSENGILFFIFFCPFSYLSIRACPGKGFKKGGRQWIHISSKRYPSDRSCSENARKKILCGTFV